MNGLLDNNPKVYPVNCLFWGLSDSGVIIPLSAHFLLFSQADANHDIK